MALLGAEFFEIEKSGRFAQNNLNFAEFTQTPVKITANNVIDFYSYSHQFRDRKIMYIYFNQKHKKFALTKVQFSNTRCFYDLVIVL